MQYGEIRPGQFYVFVHGLDVTRFVRSLSRDWSAESSTPMGLELVLNNNMAGELDQVGPSPLVYQDFDLGEFLVTRSDEASASVRRSKSTLDSGPAGTMPGMEAVIKQSSLTVPMHPYKRAVMRSRRVETGGNFSGVVVPGQSIFTPSDAVRVFFRDPDDANRWFFEFTGQVNAVSEAELASGDSYVTLSCEGVKRPFRDSRFAANRGFGQASREQITQGDLAFRTWAQDSSGFRGLSVAEIIFILAFGPVPLTELGGAAARLGGNQLNAVAGAAELTLNRTLYAANPGAKQGYASNTIEVGALAVGTFQYTRSAAVVIGSPPTNVRQYAAERKLSTQRYSDRIIELKQNDALSRYQSMIDSEVTVDDLVRMLAPGAPAPDGATNAIRDNDVEAAVRLIGGNPHLYPCEGNAVYVVTPAALSLSDSRDIVDFLPGGSADANPTFRTRLSVAMDLVERIDFRIIDTPRGDLLIEMPMYHMHPDDFGEAPTSAGRAGVASKLGSAIGGFSSAQRAKNARITARRSNYGERFRVTMNDHAGTVINVDSAQIKTLVTCHWYIDGLSAASSEKLNFLAQWPPASQLATDPLIRRFGIRDTKANPTLLVQDYEGALAYAKLIHVRNNAHATSISPASMRLRIGLWPNRPMLIEQRASDVVACSRSVQLSVSPGGVSPAPSAGTSVDFTYVKRWTGLFDYEKNARKIYAIFGLYDADPFDYAQFLTRAPKTEQVNSQRRRRKGPQK